MPGFGISVVPISIAQYPITEARHQRLFNFDRAYAKAYRDLRRQRLEQMREVNTSCQRLLDFIGADALHILLRRNLTEFVFPCDVNGGSNESLKGRRG